MSNQPYQPDPRYQQQAQGSYEGQGYGANDETVRAADVQGAYSQSQHESYVDAQGNRVESRQEVYEDRVQSRANARYWSTAITYFVLGVLEVIMGLRLLFRLLGANEDNSFITFLYSLSHVFVGPFNGIFNDQALGRSVFELSTVVAMLVYALIAWGLVSLFRLIFAPTVPGQQSVTMTRRRRS